ncbi:UNVERIFIED_CONTAM: hypothetical protein PYX00_006386 [Menopon gallinae]|uniref:Uncharacterized protein n=1 Tax=Menopon gallinae TaxID=328185 RepID=A0AAW2HV70_9NEOP
MAAAVQSGPPPGLGLSAHSSPAMTAMVSRPMPLPLPPPLMHHHSPSAVDSSGNGPPNPEVLLALLSRNKHLEGEDQSIHSFRSPDLARVCVLCVCASVCMCVCFGLMASPLLRLERCNFVTLHELHA